MSCSQQPCGGYLWENGRIPFELSSASEGVADRILFYAAAWSNPAVGFERCSADDCSGSERWLEIKAGRASAAVSLTPSAPSGPQVLTLPLSVSDERIAHELGHVIGLPDVWNRPDRDRYLTLSESAFCTAGAHGSIPTCAVGPFNGWAQPARSSTGYFGAFEASSAMNLAGHQICEEEEPAFNRTLPTAGDVSAAIELYRSTGDWSPFAPLARSVGPTTPLEYSLAKGVAVAGSPALASMAHPQVLVFTRGSDGGVYYKFQDYSRHNQTYLDWGDWFPLGCCFEDDPAAVSWSPSRIDLFARDATGRARWRSLSPSPSGDVLIWDDWKPVLTPSPLMAQSAPAVTSRRRESLDLFVRGDDHYLHWTNYENGTWRQPSRLGDRAMVGKPAVASTGHDQLEVVTVGTDGSLQWLRFNGSWTTSYTSIDGEIEPDTSPALASAGGVLHLYVQAAQTKRLRERVFDGSSWNEWRDLGGIIHGSPAAVGNPARPDVDVAAQLLDKDQVGIWLRSWPHPRPCFVAGNSCSECAEPCDGHCRKLAAPACNPSFHIDVDGNDAWTFRATDQHLYRLSGIEEPKVSDLNVIPSEVWGIGLVVGDPQAFMRIDGVESIAYTAIDGDIHETYRRKDVWGSANLSQGAAAKEAAGPAHPYRRTDGYDSIVFRGHDRAIHEIWLDRHLSRWYSASLSDYAQASLAAGDPKPFVRSDLGNTIIFRTFEGELHELYLENGHWATGNLSLAPGAAQVVGDGYGYVRSDLHNAVVHRGQDAHIHELLMPQSSHVATALDLSAVASVPDAHGDPRGYVRSDGVDAVVYTAVNGHIYELTRVDGTWVGEDISLENPPAAGDPIPYVRSDGASAVAYLGTDRRLHELTSQNDIWAHRILYEAD
jgi:hypothetical protein